MFKICVVVVVVVVVFAFFFSEFKSGTQDAKAFIQYGTNVQPAPLPGGSDCGNAGSKPKGAEGQGTPASLSGGFDCITSRYGVAKTADHPAVAI